MRKFSESEIAIFRAQAIALQCHEALATKIFPGWAYDTSSTTWLVDDGYIRLENGTAYAFAKLPCTTEVVGVLCGPYDTTTRVVVARVGDSLRAYAVGTCDHVTELYCMEGFDCDTFLLNYKGI